MKLSILETLCSPRTLSPLEMHHVAEEADGEIKRGTLIAKETGEVFPVRNYIPRFVEDINCASSFGMQWNLYGRTQIDKFNGTNITRTRFLRSSPWALDSLRGQRVLEVGCGAGAFTSIVLESGAQLFSFDYSTSVDVCWANNGPHPLLNVLQASVYAMPFKRESFDRIFCYGVLQHTPDPRRAFLSLIPLLKPGGEVSVDVYPKTRRWYYANPKYLYRKLTKRVNKKLLHSLIAWYVPRWLPVSNVLKRVPRVGWFLDSIVPCWNYTGRLPLSRQQIVEWAILDPFDALSPEYDNPQTVEEVRSWLEQGNVKPLFVGFGGRGVLAHGRKL